MGTRCRRRGKNFRGNTAVTAWPGPRFTGLGRKEPRSEAVAKIVPAVPATPYLREKSRDLVVPAPGCPREWRRPFRVVGQALRRAVSEQERDHFELTELGRPAERRRTEVVVTRRQVGASLEQFLRLRHIALARRFVERRDAQPVQRARGPVFTRVSLRRLGAVRKEQLLHALVGAQFLRYP